MELLGDMDHVESSFCLEMVFVSVQERCTVCAEHTIGSEIVLDAPDATLRCMVCAKRTIGSDIV